MFLGNQLGNKEPYYRLHPVETKIIFESKIKEPAFIEIDENIVSKLNERQKKIIPNKNLINKKLALYNTEFDFKEFREKIEMMRNLWQIDLKNLMIGELPEFDKIKKEISQKFKDL